MVKIIVDSTADMIPEVAARVGIVPLTVHFGEKEAGDSRLDASGRGWPQARISDGQSGSKHRENGQGAAG